MEGEMRGVVLLGDGKLAVKEFPDPKPGRGEVVVRTKVAAICGSDIYVYHLPQKHFEGRPELVAGHEPAGVVEAVGEGVTLVKPGDRVSLYHYVGCGKCTQCRAGLWQWCAETKGLGSHCHGGDADLVLVKEENCFILPDQLSFIDGALMACAAGTTFSALNKLQPSGLHSLAILGLGPVGLSGVIMAKAMGATVVAIGRRKIRLDLARDLGADYIFDAEDPDTPSAVRGLFPAGIDMAYETSGAPEAQAFMLQMLRRGGKAVIVAGRGADTGITPSQIVGKQLTLMGSFVIPIWMVPEMARFMVGHGLAFEKMVTHRFTIDQAKEAFELFDSGECGKVVFEWDVLGNLRSG